MDFYRKYGKRGLDILIALIGLIGTFPIWLPIALLIKWEDGGEIFFKQIRIGKDGKKFKICKFRTMVMDAEKEGKQITLKKDRRVTKIGKFLRKSKLDELPQLINVLKGEMSIVGPRPEVPKYVQLFEKEFKDILKIKPGITDIASITFIDESELLTGPNPEQVYLNQILPKKIQLAKEYLDQISLLTDLKIIFQTILKIVR